MGARKKWAKIGILAVLLLALAVATIAWPALQNWPYRNLRRALQDVNLSVARYVEATGESTLYPQSLEDVVNAGFLSELPTNPFGVGTIKLLKAADQWQPGGIVYIGAGPIIGRANSLKEASEVRAASRSEIGDWIVVAYGPKRHDNWRELQHNVREYFAGGSGAHYYDPLDLQPLSEQHAIETVKWEQVDSVIFGWQLLSENDVYVQR